jgi:hypothetical protein
MKPEPAHALLFPYLWIRDRIEVGPYELISRNVLADEDFATPQIKSDVEGLAYALISQESRGHHHTELAAFLHRHEQVAQAQQQLRKIIRDLLTEGARTGELRNDVAPDELAAYCLHALAAAGSLPSKAAVRRLVTVTLDGLRAPAA